MQDGSKVGCVGISRGYCRGNGDEIKSDGISKNLVEAVAKYFTSHECGWLGPIEHFSILCLLAIK